MSTIRITQSFFFKTDIDDTVDATVFTVNAEGTLSEDGVENNDNDAERVEIAENLNDISGTTFEHYITYLYKLSIIDGANGSYMPTVGVTRGAMSKFVMNAFRLPFDISGEQFSDVDPSNAFFVYIQSLKNAGIVDGIDNKFMPNEDIDRGSVAKFVVNTARYFDTDAVGNGSCEFSDQDSAVFSTFDSYICALADFGSDKYQKIISGYANGSYGAADKLDRQSMAKIILNAAASIPVFENSDDGSSFVNYNYENIPFVDFQRPFVAPIEVSNFDTSDETDSQILISWNNMYYDDESVIGYIVERKERDEADDKYEPLDIIVDNIVSALNPADADNKEGVLLVSESTKISYVDTDLNDETRYDYRVSAFKFIPVDFAEKDYEDQDDMEGVANYDERSNMVIGEWVTATGKTDESGSNLPPEAL